MADHDVWAAAPTPAPEPSLEARLAALERLLASQDARIAQQDARIAQQDTELIALRAGAVMDATTPEPASAEAPSVGATTQRKRKDIGSRSSRRALLKLGGAAAAAGVAAVAAGAMELGHPGTAEAFGVTWATGSVLADDETYVFPSSPSYSNTKMLTVQYGLNTPPFQQANLNAIQAFDTNQSALFNSNAVYAASYRGPAVEAHCDTGAGVAGVSNAAEGVAGVSTTGFGVHGDSTWNYGVMGTSTNSYGGYFRGGLAAIYLKPVFGAGPPATGNHFFGEFQVDVNAVIWYCVTSGTPGGWVRLPGVGNGTRGGAISYLSTPVRLLDARGGASSGLVNRGALAGNEVYAFAVAGLGGSGIPSGAQGLIANVTVLGPSGIGNLSLYPAGGSTPTVASMTFGQPGLLLANGVNVAIGTAGKVNLQNQSSGSTPLVLDAVAYVS